MYRSAIARQTRLFSTSVYLRKGPVDATKDAAKTVDRTISDAAVKGIEKGGMIYSSSTFVGILNTNDIVRRGSRSRRKEGRRHWRGQGTRGCEHHR